MSHITVVGVSDQVRHRPGCTATEDGQRLEISDLDSNGSVLSMQRNDCADPKYHSLLMLVTFRNIALTLVQ